MIETLPTENNCNILPLIETLVSLHSSVNISTLVVSFSLNEDTLRRPKIGVKCNLLPL